MLYLFSLTSYIQSVTSSFSSFTFLHMSTSLRLLKTQFWFCYPHASSFQWFPLTWDEAPNATTTPKAHHTGLCLLLQLNSSRAPLPSQYISCSQNGVHLKSLWQESSPFYKVFLILKHLSTQSLSLPIVSAAPVPATIHHNHIVIAVWASPSVALQHTLFFLILLVYSWFIILC